MIKIKDLKIGDIIADRDNCFYKILDKTDNLVAVSCWWRANEIKEEREKSYSSYASHYGESDLKDYTLVIPEWKASELKIGDKYWYIDSRGNINWDCWKNDQIDPFRLKAGLIYQTEELAQKAIDEILKD